MKDRSIIEKAKSIARTIKDKSSGENKLSVFSIGNTTKRPKGHSTAIFPVIRSLDQAVWGGVIVHLQKDAVEIAKAIDGIVDIILADAEKKALKVPGIDLGNIAAGVEKVVKKSKFFSFKANDLTVEATDAFIAQVFFRLSGRKAAIIGCGNIGSKLALKLVERGISVVITRRDRVALMNITEALNIIKPQETVAKITYTTDNLNAAIDADIIVGLTPGVPIITLDMIKVMKKDGVVIDGGKGCIFPDAIKYAEKMKIRIYRMDVRAGFEGVLATILKTEQLIKGIAGRRKINGISLVAGGAIGRKGDIVVDDINNPTAVAGIADGQGDIIFDLTENDKEKIEKAKDALNVDGNA